MLFLQQFDLQIVYKPGKQHANANALSRTPVKVGAVQLQDLLTIILKRQDPELATAITLLTNNEPLKSPAVAPGLQRSFFKDGILCREYTDSSNTSYVQFVVSSDMREVILTHLHNRLGHLGLCKTM